MTSLESAERLQNQRLAAIQQAGSVDELREAKSLDELMAIQTKMAGAQLERLMGYWASLSQSQMSQAREWFSEATAQISTGARAAAKSEPRKSA